MEQTIKPDGVILQSLTALFRDAGNLYLLSSKNQKLSTAYLVKRCATEGLGFVTKTLPALGKHFDNALKAEYFSPCPGFKRGKGPLPLFLKGLVQKVFNDDGTLKKEPDNDVIRFIRQLTFMFYKVEGEFPKDLVDEAIDNFISTDKELDEFVDLSPERAGVMELVRSIIYRIFAGFDHRSIDPRPGPGANATATPPFLLYEPTVKYLKVHEQYPYYKYYYMGTNHLLDRVRNYRKLPVMEESVALLAAVPKDSRGPRLICEMPPELMWMQQGLARKMMRWLERHPLTKGFVNFFDQTVNGLLALASSLSQEWATLDMKEASDRITRDLVAASFDYLPELRDALLSLTTDWISTDRGSFRNKKYAPMGSSLCFPVMSVVHYALGLASIAIETGKSPTSLVGSLYVYGDDLIVKTMYSEHLLEHFEYYGLKFNRDKCCYTGRFRESCGVDAHAGVDVTPIRVKKLTVSKKDGTSIQSALEVFNGLCKRRLYSVACLWEDLISEAMGDFYKLPFVRKTSSALGWIVPDTIVMKANGLEDPEKLINQVRRRKLRWCFKTHQYKMKVRVITARPAYGFDGWERLVRSQLHAKEGDTGLFTVRGSTRMLHRWVTMSGL